MQWDGSGAIPVSELSLYHCVEVEGRYVHQHATQTIFNLKLHG